MPPLRLFKIELLSIGAYVVMTKEHLDRSHCSHFASPKFTCVVPDRLYALVRFIHGSTVSIRNEALKRGPCPIFSLTCILSTLSITTSPPTGKLLVGMGFVPIA